MEIYWNIRSIFDRYLSHELDLRHLEDEFIPLVPRLAMLPADHPASSLASRVELVLAEMSNGHRSEDDLRGALREMLPMSVTMALPSKRSARNAASALNYFIPIRRKPAPPVVRVAADSEIVASKRLALARG